MNEKPYNSPLSEFMRSPWTEEKRALMEKVAKETFEEQDKLLKKYDEMLTSGNIEDA